MCGIAGIFSFNGIGDHEISTVREMNRLQHHRGPDDEGLVHDNYCVFGHKRLAIIDLSSDGHQPFYSDDKRYCLTFNGEIYNYIELREELKELGWKFKTQTDIEVLLKAYQQFGVKCLDRFNGMFAFAIYDKQTKSVFLARDRFGIKPLYYYHNGSKIVFASEIKALRSVKELKLTPDKQSLFEYLGFNRTDVYNETFYNEIKRIPKGHYAICSGEGLEIKKWWDAAAFLESPEIKPEEEILKNIREIMISSVNLRLRSDVPLGSCLSGGLDSSIIVGIIFKHFGMDDSFKTFTAAFPGDKLDETSFIDVFNQHHPFQNYRCYPDSDQAYDELDRFVYINDEPTTGPSFFSQYQVMRLAHENGVTVLLDGQGGDENFAGYQYFHGFNFTGLYNNHKYAALLRELFKTAFRKQDKEAFYTFLFQQLPDSISKSLLFNTLPHIKRDFLHHYIGNSPIHNEFFKAKDLNTSLALHFQYKLEHLLRMEDRNSMAFQIEARLPFLDYRLVEYVLGVPESLKIKKGENKILQKRAIGDFSIPEILNRKDKIGFGTPGELWMHTDKWMALTNVNYEYLCSVYPEIFKPGIHHKMNQYDRWKINQLAIWNRMSF
jgi:asparagine synthase (glutamine-hydrolysing)